MYANTNTDLAVNLCMYTGTSGKCNYGLKAVMDDMPAAKLLAMRHAATNQTCEDQYCVSSCQ